ncbi:hypothetical protein MCOR02_012017 [Pyricularia oryzae]|nr:hypothetical protein MCOR02_012017 [Pyricularia oryzae]
MAGGVVRDDGVLLSVAGATGPPHLRLSRRNATSSPGPRDKKGKTFDGEMKSKGCGAKTGIHDHLSRLADD